DNRRTLVTFVAGFTAVVTLGAALVATAAPDIVGPRCDEGQRCVAPPVRNELINDSLWQSRDGLRLEYGPPWRRLSADRRNITLRIRPRGVAVDAAMVVGGVPANRASP